MKINMDFSRFAFVCVACIAMVGMTEAGCKEDLDNNKEYQECLTGYNTYIGNAAASANTQDSTQIFTLFCSNEGKAATSCLEPHLANCQELKTDPMFSMFGVLDQSGGCANAPKSGNDVCTTAKATCMKMPDNAEADESAMEGAVSEYNKFQEQIKTICGSLKATFDCLKQHSKQCPNLEGEIKQMMEVGRQASMPGQPFPDFDSQKAFVMDECPKLPKDFTSSTCVKTQLMAAEFTTCYDNATKEHKETSGKVGCGGYKDSFPCVTTALETCGKGYQNGFREMTNFFLASTHENCQLKAADPTGSANALKMSSAVFLSLLFLVL